MRAGLIGENVGNDAAVHNFRQNIGAIADQSDGEGFSILARLVN